jgi:hypothetical protein
MNNLPRALLVTVIVLTVLVLLVACETSPVSKPGLYVNKEYRFTVKYPEEWGEMPKINPNQIFFVAPPFGLPTLDVSIAPKPDVPLEDYTKGAPALTKSLYPTTTGHKIVHEKMITLEDGTQAVEYDMEWNWDKPPVKLITTALVTYKGNKIIWIGSTGMAATPGISEKLKVITHSVKFYK